MTRITRRAAIGLLAAGGALIGLGVAGGYLLRDTLKSVLGGGMMGSGMMGSATQADMSVHDSVRTPLRAEAKGRAHRWWRAHNDRVRLSRPRRVTPGSCVEHAHPSRPARRGHLYELELANSVPQRGRLPTRSDADRHGCRGNRDIERSTTRKRHPRSCARGKWIRERWDARDDARHDGAVRLSLVLLGRRGRLDVKRQVEVVVVVVHVVTLRCHRRLMHKTVAPDPDLEPERA